MLADLADVRQGLTRAGRGAGARAGDWTLRIVESGDIQKDGWLDLGDLQEIEVVRSIRTERHLLRPFDVLVTARAGFTQAAMVPRDVSRTVAGVTLLVVRPRTPESGMGHWLWYFLTSTRGRAEMVKRMTVSATVTSLSASNLGEIEVPVPSLHDLVTLVRLVEASEDAYAAALEAARLRRESLRDSIVDSMGRHVAPIGKEMEQWH